MVQSSAGVAEPTRSNFQWPNAVLSNRARSL